ncbi:SCO family protein [Microvirga massiliensis]|uniref:SCO family protein n=1 Tax=Microvirga massiliensis TaxID=1033741 RepID=UPI000B2B777F
MSARFRTWPLAMSVALLTGALGAGAQTATAPKRSAAELMDVLMWNKEPIGGPFSLIDHTRRVKTDADFRGKWLLLYFGSTYCPDVCPTDLHVIAQAVDQLGPAGDAVQPVFITVDPERDSAEHLAEYVALFHPRLVGLTGDPAAISRAASAYKVFYAKVPAAGTLEYSVDHTAFIYLVDPAGQYVGFFPPGTSAERLGQVLRQHLPSSNRASPVAR